MASVVATIPAGPVGVIYPPPDIRGIIDKTAQFVAKNGPEFEQKVGGGPVLPRGSLLSLPRLTVLCVSGQVLTSGQKFAFLLPSNPYRAYYDMKVNDFKAGIG